MILLEKKSALKGYCYCLLLCEATHQLSRETVPGERQKPLQLVLYHFNTSNELLQLELWTLKLHEMARDKMLLSSTFS